MSAQPDDRQIAEVLDHPNRLPTVLSDLSKQNALYRRMIAVCDQVGDAALRGVRPRELTEVFAGLVGTTVVLLDPSFRVLAQAGADGQEAHVWNPWDEGATRLLAALARERRTLRVPAVPDGSPTHGWVATTITVGGNTLGYLLVASQSDDDVSDDVDLLISSYAATLFALTLVHQRTSSDLGQHYRAAMLDALVAGNFLDAQDAQRKAAILGLGPNQRYRIGVVGARLSREGRRRLMLSTELAGELTRLLSSRVPGVIGTVRGSDLIMVLPVADDADDTSGHELAASALEAVTGLLAARSLAAQLTCGLSERLSSPDAAPRGLGHASHAIELAARIGRAGQVVAYDDLGIYRLLLQIGDLRQLWDFAEDVLGDLIAYEATRNLDLIGTLSTYLNEHASLKQTARRLRVHPNTVSYRMHRIAELTDLDLADPDDRLAAHIAVKIIEAHRGARQRDADAEVWGVDDAAASGAPQDTDEDGA